MSDLKLFVNLMLFCALLSCDGALDLQGHVYDNITKRGIRGVQIILVLDNNDTIWKCKPPIPYDLNREKYQLELTDIDGHFSISSGLIGIRPGELNAKVIFYKKGYTPVIITDGEHPKFDSVQMQKVQ